LAVADVVGTRLTIFLTEDDRDGHRPLWEALVETAREQGMAGATVWRGVEGFGRSGHLRTIRFPDISRGLPLAVEIVDMTERVDAFLPKVAELAPGALVTREEVALAHHRPAGAEQA
jgi:PII-like signaling protein